MATESDKRKSIFNNNITKARYEFFNRKQQNKESLDVFVAALSSLSKQCEFGKLQDSLIKDVMIFGLSSSSAYGILRDKLIDKDPVSLDDAIKLAVDIVTCIQGAGQPKQTNWSKKRCKNITNERYKLFIRKQKPGESLDTFVEALNSLSMSCDFGGLRDSLVKDMMISGLANRSVYDVLRNQLIILDPSCVDEAIRLSIQIVTSHLKGAGDGAKKDADKRSSSSIAGETLESDLIVLGMKCEICDAVHSGKCRRSDGNGERGSAKDRSGSSSHSAEINSTEDIIVLGMKCEACSEMHSGHHRCSGSDSLARRKDARSQKSPYHANTMSGAKETNKKGEDLQYVKNRLSNLDVTIVKKSLPSKSPANTSKRSSLSSVNQDNEFVEEISGVNQNQLLLKKAIVGKEKNGLDTMKTQNDQEVLKRKRSSSICAVEEVSNDADIDSYIEPDSDEVSQYVEDISPIPKRAAHCQNRGSISKIDVEARKQNVVRCKRTCSIRAMEKIRSAFDDEMEEKNDPIEVKKEIGVEDPLSLKSIKSNDYRCMHCPKKCKSWTGIRNHLRKTHPRALGWAKSMQETWPYECLQCGSRFNAYDSLKVHIRSSHHGSNLKVKWLSCLYCSDTYMSESALKRHLGKHFRKLTCDICQKVYSFKRDLRRHIISGHYKEPYNKNCSFSKNISSQLHNSEFDSSIASGEINKSMQDNTTCLSKANASVRLQNEASINLLKGRIGFDTDSAAVCHDFAHVGQILDKAVPEIKQERDEIENEAQPNLDTEEMQRDETANIKRTRYRCMFCFSKFKCWTGIRNHFRKYPKNLKWFEAMQKAWPHECAVCTMRFNNVIALQRHILRRHENMKKVKWLKCMYCTDSFLSEITFKQHVNKHITRSFKCDICEKAYGFKYELKRHIMGGHFKEPYNENGYLAKSFFAQSRSSVLDSSLASGYNKQSIPDNPVNAFVSPLDEINMEHGRFYFDNNAVLFGDFVNAGQILDKTVRERDEAENYSQPCIVGPEIMQIDETTNVPNGLKHVNRKGYKCMFCYYNFKCWTGIRNHFRKLHTKNLKWSEAMQKAWPHECAVCTMRFNNVIALQRHILRRHENMKKVVWLKCMYCTDSFLSEITFKQHVNKHITRSFKCDICEKAYGFKYELKRHIMTGHFEEPYNEIDNYSKHVAMQPGRPVFNPSMTSAANNQILQNTILGNNGNISVSPSEEMGIELENSTDLDPLNVTHDSVGGSEQTEYQCYNTGNDSPSFDQYNYDECSQVRNDNYGQTSYFYDGQIENNTSCDQTNAAIDYDNNYSKTSKYVSNYGSHIFNLPYNDSQTDLTRFPGVDDVNSGQIYLQNDNSPLNHANSMSIQDQCPINRDFVNVGQISDTAVQEIKQERDQIENEGQLCLVGVERMQINGVQNVSSSSNPVKRKRYKCMFCCSKFKCWTGIRNHFRKYPKNLKWFEAMQKAWPHECAACTTRFDNETALQRHILRRHENMKKVKWLKCVYCPDSFLSETILKQHIDKHITRNLSCGVCQKAYSFKYELKRHIVNSHFEDHANCLSCGKSYKGTHHCARERKKNEWDRSRLHTKQSGRIDKDVSSDESNTSNVDTPVIPEQPISPDARSPDINKQSISEQEEHCVKAGYKVKRLICVLEKLPSQQLSSLYVKDNNADKATHKESSRDDDLNETGVRNINMPDSKANFGKSFDLDLDNRAKKERDVGDTNDCEAETISKDFNAIDHGRYRCLFCPKSFDIWSTLEGHFQHFHSEKTLSLAVRRAWPYSCSKCESRFEDIDSKLRHVSHTSCHKEKFPCKYCKKFYPKDGMKRHLLKHKSGFICDVCQRKFLTKKGLKVHFLSGHSKKKKKYDYCVCGKNAGLNVHPHRCSYKNAPVKFACELCGKGFTQLGNLKMHLKRHTGEKEYLCNECGKSYFAKDALQKHLQAGHPVKIKYECDLCTMSFEHKVGLTIHRRSHRNLEMYDCKVCKMLFSTRWHLDRHLMKHSGERVFNCHFCGTGLTSKKIGERHLRTYHLHNM